MGNSVGLQTCRGRWALCLDEGQKEQLVHWQSQKSGERLEELLQEFIRLQDLKKNGVIEEVELIKINQKIEKFHRGLEADMEAVREKYSRLFREKLDPEGRPVSYDIYRRHLREELCQYDKDRRAQEMILEQWIAEVESARRAFFIPEMQSMTDVPFRAMLSCADLGIFGDGAGIADQGPSLVAEHLPALSKYDVPDMTYPSQTSLDSFIPQPRCHPLAAGGLDVPTAVGTADPVYVQDEVDNTYSSLDSFVPHPKYNPSLPSRPVTLPVETLGRDTAETTGPGLSTPEAAATLGTLTSGRRAENSAADGPNSQSLPTRQTKTTFVKSEEVQVWSNSKKKWLRGVVLEVFPAATICDGFKVPAGTVKATSEAGVKWVMPDQVSQILRKRPAPAPRAASAPQAQTVVTPPFSQGDLVQVWSDTRKEWLDAIVREAFPLPTRRDNFAIPAGTLRVRSAAGDKWILPDHACSMLRAPPSSEGRASYNGKGTAGSAPFVMGKDVQMRSETPQRSGGVVDSATSELKAVLAQVMNNPERLASHVNAVWHAVRGDEEGLGKERVTWALEGLASQFDVRLDIQGPHMAEVLRQFDALDPGGRGSLSQNEFQELSRRMIAKLHATL